MSRRFRISPLRFLPVALAVCSAGAWAEVELLTPRYDFGVMKEEAGPATGRALLVNHGPEDAVITQVRPSCGCTGADYQQTPFAPGDTAWVTFTYDPSGRPGRFEKTVKVVTAGSDGDPATNTIRICGTVLGRPESLDRYYPVEAGATRLTEKTILFGNLRKGTARHFFVKAYNQTPDTIHPRLSGGDKAMDVSVLPEAVGPGDIATLSFYLNSRFIDKTGPVEYRLVFTPDSVNPADTCVITLAADII